MLKNNLVEFVKIFFGDGTRVVKKVITSIEKHFLDKLYLLQPKL